MNIQDIFKDYIPFIKKRMLYPDGSIKTGNTYKIIHNNKNFMNHFYKFYTDEYFKDVLYCIIRDIPDIPKCVICGKQVRINKMFPKGFDICCCEICKDEYNKIEKNKQLEELNEDKLNNPHKYSRYKNKYLNSIGCIYYQDLKNYNYVIIKDFCKHGDIRLYKTHITNLETHPNVSGTLCEECNREIYNSYIPSVEEIKHFQDSFSDFYSKYSQGMNEQWWLRYYPKEKKILDVYYDRLFDSPDVYKDRPYSERYIVFLNRMASIPRCRYAGCNELVNFIQSTQEHSLYCEKHKYAFHSESLFECEVRDFINSLGIETLNNSRNIIHPKELDIYVEEKKFAVECNGSYYHMISVLPENNELYHKEKYDLCRNKGIDLLSIWEDFWKLKNDLSRDIIKKRLGVNIIDINPDDCILIELDMNDDEIIQFIESGSFYTPVKTDRLFGLYYDDLLVYVFGITKCEEYIEIVNCTERFSYKLKEPLKYIIKFLNDEYKECSCYKTIVDTDYMKLSEYMNIMFEIAEYREHYMIYYKDGVRMEADTDNDIYENRIYSTGKYIMFMNKK